MYCDICDARCNSRLQYEQHITGRKHRHNVQEIQTRNMNRPRRYQHYQQSQYYQSTRSYHESYFYQTYTSHSVGNDSNNESITNKGECDEDEVELISAKQSTRCPLTYCIMQSPVRSKCRHVFESSAIHTYIKSNNGTAECPIPGCSSYICCGDLKEDLETKNLIQNAKLDENNTHEILDLISDSEDEEEDTNDNSMSSVPVNYICKRCGQAGKHWIMHCNKQSNDDIKDPEDEIQIISNFTSFNIMI